MNRSAGQTMSALDNNFAPGVVPTLAITELTAATKGESAPSKGIEVTLFLDMINSELAAQVDEQIQFQVLKADFKPRAWGWVWPETKAPASGARAQPAGQPGAPLCLEVFHLSRLAILSPQRAGGFR